MAIDTPLHMERGQRRLFPSGFSFGSATSSYQIEGAADEDGRLPSIWDTFSRIPGAVLGGDTGDIACDHYHRYPEDVRLMRELGLDVYRFSVSWARVVPDGRNINRKGVDFYARLVDELLAQGIRPWVTLYHWDLPQAVEDLGGWVTRDTSHRFRDYAMTVFEALHDRVPTWTTLNEPWCSSFLSYTAGAHAPGHQSVREGMLASHHLLLGHGLALDEMRSQGGDTHLGITLNLTNIEPVDPAADTDLDAARKIDGQFNRWFLDPLFKGRYPADTIEDIRQVDPSATEDFEAAIHAGDLDLISAKIDTLGINYYQGDVVSGSPVPPPPPGAAPVTRKTGSPYPNDRGVFFGDQHLPHTSMGWDVDPVGFTRLLARVHQDYSGPAGTAIYITENGAAYRDIVTPSEPPAVHDQERSDYLELHLGSVLDAIDVGADIRGYFYWTLLDNFEWAWGYSERFGIIHIDYDSQRRTIKDSGRLYQRIIRDRSIDVAPGAGGLLATSRRK